MRAIAREEAHGVFKKQGFLRHDQIVEIVDDTVRKTLISLGLDVADPTEVQENFSNLRSWSDMKRTISKTLVEYLSKSVFIGLLALLGLGFYVWMTGHRPPP